jgi:hypothetical protein
MVNLYKDAALEEMGTTEKAQSQRKAENLEWRLKR